ncbi:zinc carboxypeptidase [Tamaricihabitans halophyticus]|uniref:Zinc carboxypeptidase n=1 Tax=Tamaricihabitans halophyticus TaxID=1262583 RepID=A0A4R2R5E8_9PSEU|nr:M14 family metallocarboxypeptidase [Tamaricihabitans halophyticus]TCP57257.1 zinc carboxypeptidase [Tamaricihabitans halophyticus]
MRTSRSAIAPRLLSAVAALALTVGLAGTATADESTVEPPRTGFEESGGERWTSLDEEAAFLAEIAADRPNVAVDQVGASVQGRPLQLVRINEAKKPRNTVLLVCSQHGDEPAGREACLSTIRNLAYPQDGPTFPRGTEVLVLPNANPDGHAANTRENADGTDINRDHLALGTPEARAIAEVIRDDRPDIVQDLHEFGPRPPYYVKDFLSLWPRNLNTHDAVYEESVRLNDDYVRPAVEAAGFSTGIYGITTDPETGEPIEQIAGDGQERILRNTTGIKNSVGLLSETRTDSVTGEPPAQNNQNRVNAHLAELTGTMRLVEERGMQLAKATMTARTAGYGSKAPIYLGGADNEEPTPEQIIDPAPCGYRLTGEQYDSVTEKLALHGVRSWPIGQDRYVPLRQEMRALVPLLLDERAAEHLTTGTPVACR